MNSRSEDAEARPASSAELSLDISRVVSQVLNGGDVDVARTGEELAARYQNLGMSGAMIEEAISRAAGMVGMIRGAEKPIEPEVGEGNADRSSPAGNGSVSHGTDPYEPARQPLGSNGAHHDSIEADFGALIFGPAVESGAPVNGNAAAPPARDKDGHRRGDSFAKGAVAVLRRALFRG